jgi:hypothetical protein
MAVEDFGGEVLGKKILAQSWICRTYPKSGFVFSLCPLLAPSGFPTVHIGRRWLKTSGSNPAIGGGPMSEIVLTWAAFVLWFCSNYKILLAWRRVEGRHIAAVAASAAIAAGPTIGH